MVLKVNANKDTHYRYIMPSVCSHWQLHMHIESEGNRTFALIASKVKFPIMCHDV